MGKWVRQTAAVPALALAAWGALVVLSAASAPPPEGPPAALRVAYVDLDRIAEQAGFVREMKRRIETEYETRSRRLREQQATYANLLDELQRQESVLNRDALEGRLREAFLLKARLDAERFAIDKLLRDAEAQKGPALERILATAREVAQEAGYDIVFRRDQLVYGAPGADLSEAVIARLNAATDDAAATASQRRAP